MASPPFRSKQLTVESLETREMPAAGDWFVEPFIKSISQGMPTGWAQWSSSGSAFTVDAANLGLGGQGRLVSSGASISSGRVWANTSYAADVEASAAVYLSSAIPIQLFVRGTNLNSTTPSYYSVSVSRGLEVQLLEVNNGKSSVLGSLKSAEWISNKWVTVTIRTEGDRLRAFVHRGDTNQYLNAQGQWSGQVTAAIERRDSTIKLGGQVGFSRGAKFSGDVLLDSLRIGPPGTSAFTPIREERFNSGVLNTLPSGWSQWSSGSVAFSQRDDETLDIAALSTGSGRAWMTQPVPTNVQVSSSVYIDSMAQSGIFARGSSVNTTKPNYYALQMKRGLEVELVRVVNGVSTRLGYINTTGWQSGLWVQMSLIVSGNELRAQILRSDTGEYLSSNGTWGLSPTWAFKVTDTSLPTGGLAGVIRGSGAAGDMLYDNFIVNTPPTNITVPRSIPTGADKPTTVPLPPPDVTPTLPPTVPPTVPPTSPPPPAVPPASPPPPTVPPNASLPVVDRNFDYIRVASLAYYGTPLTSYELSLVKDGVDLIVSNLSLVDSIAKASPTTPQMVYTNVTNLYLGLLTDWLEYADRNKLSRESAFYHVNKSTEFFGLSASAVPVNQFWKAILTSNAATTDITSQIRTANASTFLGGKVGDQIALGFTEKFREINVQIKTPASGSWVSVLEYVKAVDAYGKPTAWGTMPLLSNTTNGLKQSGQFIFDPPKDWVTASINGSAKLYYARIRTTAAGVAPSVVTILGRDYAHHDGNKGTIPAFDFAADLDKDGYLNDAEYAKRTSGFNARFVYESRLTFPYYGPNRFATNVASIEFRNWAIDYHTRFLKSQPLIQGFFVDNSTGRLPVDPTTVRENVSNYANDYGVMLGALNKAIGSKWLVSNTAGGGKSIDSQIANGVTTLEEFALRPLSANHVQFEDLMATVVHRTALGGGKTYQILDSLPTQLDAANPRVMTSTLAMYYMVGDPNLTMLMINGGNEPASSWKRHWTDAIKFNVGKPKGVTTQFAVGLDPSNRNLTYKIYQRQYENALVLYKPVSYTRGVNGTIADNTATTHALNGWYRVVHNDGTLGARVNTITLRNGEGVVLAKA